MFEWEGACAWQTEMMKRERSAKKEGSEKKGGMQSEMRFSQAAAKENGHWVVWRREKNLKIMRS